MGIEMFHVSPMCIPISMILDRKNEMNFKPFDLEAAKSGAPIVTRDGREARFIAHVPETKRPVLIYVKGDLCCGEYSISGSFQFDHQEHPRDIFMKLQKRMVWVNMYKDCCYNMKMEPLISARVFNTEREAKISGHDTGILAVAVPIEIEE